MRFMYIVKHPGPPGNPTPQLMEAMHKLADARSRPAACSTMAG